MCARKEDWRTSQQQYDINTRILTLLTMGADVTSLFESFLELVLIEPGPGITDMWGEW